VLNYELLAFNSTLRIQNSKLFSYLRSPARYHPSYDRVRHADGEQGPKDQFVVSCQPKRQVNIKVVPAVLSEARCHVCQGTPHSIEGQDCYLYQNEADQACSHSQASLKRICRGCKNASREYGPNDRVSHLHNTQRGLRFHWFLSPDLLFRQGCSRPQSPQRDSFILIYMR